ncbi:MAG: nicotinate-nucleotide adenylyltransferase [Lachnospiraceae bacterium]|nr:nicotinate-nucleotide adenylyltransferase [Lachnospiraceae bacterium]
MEINRHRDNTNRRIGIMGGAFNPIHYGHLMIAENAREQFSLEQVLFVPTGRSPLKHKQQVTDKVHRCAMVNLAISDNPWFALDKVEINSPEISYTFLTVEKLKEYFISSELFFILGADSLFDFESWRSPELILKNCSILAAYREHQRQEEFFEQIAYLNEKYPQKFCPLDTPNLEVSSQEIRQRVNEGRSIRYLVPEAVETYIRDNKLYLD